MFVWNVNYSIYFYENGNKEILFFEIWINGSLIFKEVFYEVFWNLIDLLIFFLYIKEENFNLEDN